MQKSRAISLLGSAAFIALLASCGSGASRYSDPNDYTRDDDVELCTEQDERIAELEEQLENARTQLAALSDSRDQLRSAADDLQSNVDRLANENWRDVVPDIDSSSAEVSDQSDQIDSDVSDAESALE